ncbi:glutamyl-tRNA reductase-binding protein, chloroplastic [Ricinus communis]|uniref:glutamyl-tRNA reductase-binding protein, chloroplastic n=1 Tax=Ricinus communis TaxID=3988 RepID=UPI00201A55E6|nr:glutamyl-tRNA reductase-binding protein, chloroplastic [Ricinus communis]
MHHHHLQTQSLTPHFPLSHLFLPRPTTTRLHFPRQFPLRSSLSTVSEPHAHVSSSTDRPFPAEVSRTIMELSSVATLSTLTRDNWPLGVGVRFAVDDDGTPILCFNHSHTHFSLDTKSTLHVQFEQCGMRTPQCTIQGCLHKPEDSKLVKWHQSIWKKRFGEDVDDDLIHVIAVDRVLQMEDYMEDGVWVTSLDYKEAIPDPLRDSAEAIVSEINAKNSEDVYRFCNIYVDLDFQVSEAKMIWIDRLGFDLRLSCPEKGVFDVRIPFPREVTDVKSAKSSFNCMSQLAWEVEKNYQAPDFKKVKHLKQIRYRGL